MNNASVSRSRRNRFRILCLDGGGIKGAFTASVIANLNHMMGGGFSKHFDLITGTSTGGLIALALGLGKSPEEILEFYVKDGPELFGHEGVYQRVSMAIRGMIQPKHSSERLKQSLHRVFGDKRLGHSANRLVIPSFNCLDGSLVMFKTAHHPLLVKDYVEFARDVAMATSAAPTYFQASRSGVGKSYIDGGVWANSPIVVGILEAIYKLDKRPSEIDVLSIGTTAEPFSVGPNQRGGGQLDWRLEIVPLMIHAQIKTVEAQAGLMTNQRLVRINPIAERGRFRLDGADSVLDLVGLGESEAAKAFQEPLNGKNIQQIFFKSPAAPFIPILQIQNSTSQSDPTGDSGVPASRKSPNP